MSSAVDRAWAILQEVPDPELPVVSVVDLGIVRSVDASGGGLVVTLTPTYSGCPALREIEADVLAALSAEFALVEVQTALSPAWTTDWLTEAGRAKLLAAGIAPPASRASGVVDLPGPAVRPRCPHCGAPDVAELSAFGSTACKALWRCRSCGEPFDYVKPH